MGRHPAVSENQTCFCRPTSLKGLSKTKAARDGGGVPLLQPWRSSSDDVKADRQTVAKSYWALYISEIQRGPNVNTCS
mgnify:FL=1